MWGLMFGILKMLVEKILSRSSRVLMFPLFSRIVSTVGSAAVLVVIDLDDRVRLLGRGIRGAH